MRRFEMKGHTIGLGEYIKDIVKEIILSFMLNGVLFHLWGDYPFSCLENVVC